MANQRIATWAFHNSQSATRAPWKRRTKTETSSTAATIPSWRISGSTGWTQETLVEIAAWRPSRSKTKRSSISISRTSKRTTLRSSGHRVDCVTSTVARVDGTCCPRESKAGCGQQIKFRLHRQTNRRRVSLPWLQSTTFTVDSFSP